MRDFSSLQLYLAHRAALIDYAAPIVGCRARAEDVVQEAVIRFMAGGVEAERAVVERPVAYLYRIVRNVALDWTRRRALERRRQGDEQAWWLLPDVPRTPEQELLYRTDVERVTTALQRLPARTRLALELHRFAGHTLTEVAENLGVSVTTAHRLVREALIAVAEALAVGDGG